jgi:hypothetical protein
MVLLLGGDSHIRGAEKIGPKLVRCEPAQPHRGMLNMLDNPTATDSQSWRIHCTILRAVWNHLPCFVRYRHCPSDACKWQCVLLLAPVQWLLHVWAKQDTLSLHVGTLPSDYARKCAENRDTHCCAGAGCGEAPAGEQEQ